MNIFEKGIVLDFAKYGNAYVFKVPAGFTKAVGLKAGKKYKIKEIEEVEDNAPEVYPVNFTSALDMFTQKNKKVIQTSA